MFKIDKNIAMPEVKLARRGAAQKYPFDNMKPGDSFFVPVDEGQDLEARRQVIGSSARARGYRINTRCVTEDGVKGVRIFMAGRRD